jgi:aryl-alcohol dehydrogenase-like predicted oxidoreductase
MPSTRSLPYSPLGRGFLTGRFRRFEDLPEDDFRRRQPRFQGENFQKNLDLVHHVERVASRKGCTPSQLVLAWLLHQGDDIVPIPGTKRVEFLEDNVGALGVTLTQADLERIDAVFPRGVAAGERYLEGGMATVNR